MHMHEKSRIIDRIGAVDKSRARSGQSILYSLRVAENVKKHGRASGSKAVPRNRTRVSPKHQVTIPASAFRTAGLAPGDTLRVEAASAGRVVLTRIDELIDRYSGCLDTGGDLRERVEGLREEWR